MLELDHVLVCTSAVAIAEAQVLLDLGLREGPPNRHPGQGTANRRFVFANAMVELLWVEDASEAQGEVAAQTRLWERWRDRATVCPFGICMRPSRAGAPETPPFPGWTYQPAYLPDPLSMHVGDAGLDEPMWVYLDFLRREAWESRFVAHPAGLREVTEVTIQTPTKLTSAPARRAIEDGVLSGVEGREFALELQVDGGRRGIRHDLRPTLPMVIHT